MLRCFVAPDSRWDPALLRCDIACIGLRGCYVCIICAYPVLSE